MDQDSEALQQSLLMILQEFLPELAAGEAEAISQRLGQNNEFMGVSVGYPPDSENLQDASSTPSDRQDPEHVTRLRETLLNGDIPAVQDRFQALLKHRLQTEIQRNPPLFPWETEIHDYETDPVGVANAGVSATPEKVPALVWMNHLKEFSLPVPLPENILAQLLERCQDIVQSSLLEGAKLVRAVEDLFPGQAPALNQLAGMVMAAPARSGRSGMTNPPPGVNYPTNYEAAVPAQQMVLSLLAAREIISVLTIAVSSQQPRVERQWMTELGALTLTTIYEPEGGLRILGKLPFGGSLTLKGEGVQSMAERSTAGGLNVELVELNPAQGYALEVRFLGAEQPPLVFTIRIAD